MKDNQMTIEALMAENERRHLVREQERYDPMTDVLCPARWFSNGLIMNH